MQVNESLTKDLLTACKQRYSVRKFDEKQIDDATKNTIQEYIDQLNKLGTNLCKLVPLYENCMECCNKRGKTIQNAQAVYGIIFTKLQDSSLKSYQQFVAGLTSELLVLYLYKLGIKTCHLGSDGIMFSSAKFAEMAQCDEPRLVVVAGYKDEDITQHQYTKRIGFDKMCENWPEQDELFEVLNRSPSSMNNQPYTFVYVDNKTIQIKPCRRLAYRVVSLVSSYDYNFDIGIAAAHACCYYKNSTLTHQDKDVYMIKQD